MAVLRVVGTDLIVGGAFDSTSGGVRLKAIARWNGTSWAPIGGLFDGSVRDIEMYRGELIATGWFPTVEGIAVNHIARWDGTAWRPLGAGLESDSLTNPSGIAMAVYGDELIVAGRFQRAGGVPAANIARWDGQAWHSMGAGLTGSTISWVGNEVKDLAVYRGELIVAGEFILADGRPSPYWARWTNSSVPGIAHDPRSVNVREGATIRLESSPFPGYEAVVVRWSRDGVDVVDGPGGASINGGFVQGAAYELASPTDGTPAVLTILDAQPSDSGTYVAVFSSECGSSSSTPAVVTVCCKPDLDCSGGVDGDDVIAFFTGWNAGRPDADFDQDGTVDGDDVIAFFEHWDIGC